MASPQFHAYDRILRRMAQLDLVEQHLEASARAGFRASIVVNARTGRPIVPAEPHPATAGRLAVR